jgi:membrane-associated phospholipid phosphatase
MGRGIWRLVSGRLWGPTLLPVAGRRPAAVFAAVCVAATAVLAMSVPHHAGAGWPDTAVDPWIQAGLGRYPWLVTVLPRLGDKVPVAIVTGALVVACLVTRRWRGVVLAGVAVLASAVITEKVLKPITGLISDGWHSFPSGHATATFALAAVCAVLLTGPSRPRLPAALRLFVVLAAVLVAGAVSAAMVARDSHEFTDIIGGAAVGTATVLLTALVLDWLIPTADTGTGDTSQADEAGLTARRD